MSGQTDCAVIGAGPAGMAAAMAMLEAGLEVTVIDSEPRPGGQIYRNVDSSPLTEPDRLGADYVAGAALVSAFRQAPVRCLTNTDVWYIAPDGEVAVKSDGRVSFIQARRIVIATGAQERAVPFEGWTLPGVVTVGAGQILLKSAGIVPSEGVVLAGMGPLLLLVASQYLNLGVRVRAILDLTPRGNLLRAVRHLPAAAIAGDYLAKGLQMMRKVRRAGVPVFYGIERMRAVGEDRIEAVEFTAKGRKQGLETAVLMTHFGLIPRTTLTRAAGIAHDWDASQQCWRPRADIRGRTDRPKILVAGDCRGIFGARSAKWSGRLAGIEAARSLDRLSTAERNALARPALAAIRRDHRIRPFLETLYALPDACWRDLSDEIMVCRCEEVTVGEIRAAARAGATGSGQVKGFTRAGMGLCQGRQCGESTAWLIAQETGTSPRLVPLPRARFPLEPIELGVLADLEPPSPADRDNARPSIDDI